jgi:DNA ligase-1
MYLDTLELLEYTSGTKDKENLLKNAAAWDTDLPPIMDAVYSFNRKYFLKQLPVLDNAPPYIGGHLPEFMELLKKLETRQVTGDVAHYTVQKFFNTCTTLERKWFQRILLKDLRVGMGISSVNKAGFNIPEFQVQLAKDGKSNKKLNYIIERGVWVSRKYDGYRCLAVVTEGKAVLYTRNGKEYENFPTIVAALEKICPTGQFVLDGELLSDNFQAIQRSAFASKRGTTVGDVKYHIFDLIPAEEWKTQNFKTGANERYADLQRFFQAEGIASLPLVEVEHIPCSSLERILELEREYIAEGFEGAMILPLDMPYYLGRKTNGMMKFKTMLSMDCEILAVYEGEGKYQGTLGGFELEQENGLKCKVGSGFSDEDRNQIWKQPDLVIGRTIEIQYQNLSDDGIMRFPVTLRYRDDK